MNYLKYILFSFFCLVLIGQDTTWVETLTFDDITKRRDIYLFPDGTEDYKRVLMYHTLKCDNATTQDNFACGEWDYANYTFVYYKDGIVDSSYISHPSFEVNGQSFESFDYSLNPIYDTVQETQSMLVHEETISYEEYVIGTDESELVIDNENPVKIQMLYSDEELVGSGLPIDSGISGLTLNFNGIASGIKNFEIRLMETTKSELTDIVKMTSDAVYAHNLESIATGSSSFQFLESYIWQGSNLIVEITIDAIEEVNGFSIQGIMDGSSVMVTSEDTYLNFSGNRYVEIDKSLQIIGEGHRTIEGWCKPKVFNSGGLFQAGRTGSTGQDFSLRTTGTENQWRVQQWGAPDFDATLDNSFNEWHHYAVSFDGTTTKLYYDGELAAQEVVTINTGSNNLWLGRWSGSYLNGHIDNMRFWDVALDQEIIQNWKQKHHDGHPNSENLTAAYYMNEGMGNVTYDALGSAPEGDLRNLPWWNEYHAHELYFNAEESNFKAMMTFEIGEYVSTIETSIATSEVQQEPKLLELFENASNGIQISNDSENHPAEVTSSAIVWSNEFAYTYNTDGEVIDSTSSELTESIENEVKEWYSPEVRFEIGRFITPYGIGLDLGPDGFTWVYDVTDYLPILKDSVDLSSGSQSELIDLKFAFIKGKPTRDVISVNNIWGTARNLNYKDIDDDTELSNITMPLHSEALQWKVVSRVTGHGHNSNTGDYPHCCEWKDNIHYLYLNGDLADNWHIFQYQDCANNPVYPQGGTWPGAREGWCPGDIVKGHSTEITSFISNGDSTVNIDYGITPVPSNNLGMGNGKYLETFQLVHYGSPNYERDIEILDVIAPSNQQIHGRFNPLCTEPSVIIQNNGSETITEMIFKYGVEGDEAEVAYHFWQGEISYLEQELVTLPIVNADFWIGTAANKFIIEIISVNNDADEQNITNNKYVSSYVRPDIWDSGIRFELRTNNEAFENQFSLKNLNGTVIEEELTLSNNTVYSISVPHSLGCYTLEILDNDPFGGDGLSYWANTAAGSGYLRIKNENNATLKTFEPEFGYQLIYAFNIGEVDILPPVSPVYELRYQVFGVSQNPVNDILQIEISGLSGNSKITITNMQGQMIQELNITSNGTHEKHQLDVSQMPVGAYLVGIQNNHYSESLKVIVSR